MKKLTAIVLDNNTKIKYLEQEEVYKYLGVNERSGIGACHHEGENKKESRKRVRKPLKQKQIRIESKYKQIKSKQLIYWSYLKSLKASTSSTEIRHTSKKWTQKFINC